MKRRPAVAGYFYPGEEEELKAILESLIEPSDGKVHAISVVSPHAGYMYSGKVAGKVFGKIFPPDTAVILGPNHTGMGKSIALYPGDSFLTPLGEAKIDQDIQEAFLNSSSLFALDEVAHRHEHSIEVQIPFLQYINPYVKIVPICVSYINFDEIIEIGNAISQAIKEFPGKKVLIVASSDFSHYVAHEVAKEKDFKAIEKILSLDEVGLINIVVQENISMCGVIPVSIAITASKSIKPDAQAELVSYQTSGDVIKDYSSVVGYGGILIY